MSLDRARDRHHPTPHREVSPNRDRPGSAFRLELVSAGETPVEREGVASCGSERHPCHLSAVGPRGRSALKLSSGVVPEMADRDVRDACDEMMRSIESSGARKLQAGSRAEGTLVNRSPA